VDASTAPVSENSSAELHSGLVVDSIAGEISVHLNGVEGRDWGE
jgi:hypothetical protein